MLQWLVTALASPILNAGIEGWKAKLQSDNDRDKIAAELAGRELAVQQKEAELQGQLKVAQIGHAWEPEKLAMYITLLFYGKCVVWDTVLGLGTTPSLKGDVSVWAGMIMAFYFSKRTVENAIRIFKR